MTSNTAPIGEATMISLTYYHEIYSESKYFDIIVKNNIICKQIDK